MRNSDLRLLEHIDAEADSTEEDEGNYIFIEEKQEGGGGCSKEPGGMTAKLQDIPKRTSFMQRLMGVKNSQCELFLERAQREMEQVEAKELRTLQNECSRLQHDLRVLQVDQKKQQLSERRSKEPEANFTLDENMVHKMAKFLSHWSDCPCYLDKSIWHPIRKTVQSDFVSSAVKRARRMLQQQRHARTQAKKSARTVQFLDIPTDDSPSSERQHKCRHNARSAISSSSLPPSRPEKSCLVKRSATSCEEERPRKELVLPQLNSASSNHKPGSLVTTFQEPQHPPRPHTTTPRKSTQGNCKLTIASLRTEQLSMNRRIQSFYRALKEDRVRWESVEKSRLHKTQAEEESGPPLPMVTHRAFTSTAKKACHALYQSKARKRWHWALEKVLNNLDEMLDQTYGDSYSILLPSTMQKRLADDEPEYRPRLAPMSLAKQRPPTHSERRANRNSATFQLQKIVRLLMESKVKENEETPDQSTN